MRCRIALAVVCLMVGGSGAALAYNLERVDGNPCGFAQNLFWRGARATVDPSFLNPSSFGQLADTAGAAWNATLTRFQFVAGSALAFCDNRDHVISLG